MKIFSEILLSIFRWLLPKRFRHKGLRFVWEIIKNNKKQFTIFRLWPRFSKDVNIWSDDTVTGRKFKLGIVIQGPLNKADDFTLETIRIYKKTFDDAIIILSTWEDEDEDYLKKIKQERIDIVFNKKPANPGPFNINMQLVSSARGLKRAKEMGAHYALKTRTDQRIYGVNVFDFLYNLTELFPVASGYKQNKRIVSTNIFTFKYGPYLISDMTVFGQIDDMLTYWTADLDTRITLPSRYTTEREYIEMRVGEVYIVSEFLKKIGHELKWTISDHWQTLADHFCIVDHQALDIYWHKVERHKFRENKYSRYDFITNARDLSFREWLNLYRGRGNKKLPPESVLDRPLHGIMSK